MIKIIEFADEIEINNSKNFIIPDLIEKTKNVLTNNGLLITHASHNEIQCRGLSKLYHYELLRSLSFLRIKIKKKSMQILFEYDFRLTFHFFWHLCIPLILLTMIYLRTTDIFFLWLFPFPFLGYYFTIRKINKNIKELIIKLA